MRGGASCFRRLGQSNPDTHPPTIKLDSPPPSPQSSKCKIVTSKPHADLAPCTATQVTKFAGDHPGGDELILAYAGKDITSIMSDPQEHSHSTSAFELLQEYQVGRLGVEETITNPDFVWEDHFVPKDTDNDQDWEKNQFLDLNRPLVPQMLRSEFSKAFYLQQVHQPR
jgi:cytochrome b involved in lipid metabolism